MTANDVKNYRFLDRAIRIAEKKLDEARELSVLRDKVIGSNPDFPYEERSFNIGGERDDRDPLAKAEYEVKRLKLLKWDIEYALTIITDPGDKVIFERTMQGYSQTQIGIILGVNHSTVSRRLAKICECM